MVETSPSRTNVLGDKPVIIAWRTRVFGKSFCEYFCSFRPFFLFYFIFNLVSYTTIAIIVAIVSLMISPYFGIRRKIFKFSANQLTIGTINQLLSIVQLCWNLGSGMKRSKASFFFWLRGFLYLLSLIFLKIKCSLITWIDN